MPAGIINKKKQMKNLLLLSALIILMLSCIPDNVKEEMDKGMMLGQQMMADQEFKKAIAQIELHKLRNGSYPSSLSELKFLTAMDSSIFNYVEYTSLDSVYELNLNMEFPTLSGEEMQRVELQYPSEFWKGLGCVKSNVKSSPLKPER